MSAKREINWLPDPKPPVLCEHCGGNGEIVTDWDAYLGNGVLIADAVADCEPCCGTGYTDYAAHLGISLQEAGHE